MESHCRNACAPSGLAALAFSPSPSPWIWVKRPSGPAGGAMVSVTSATAGEVSGFMSSPAAAFHCTIVATWPEAKAALASAYS